MKKNLRVYTAILTLVSILASGLAVYADSYDGVIDNQIDKAEKFQLRYNVESASKEIPVDNREYSPGDIADIRVFSDENRVKGYSPKVSYYAYSLFKVEQPKASRIEIYSFAGWSTEENGGDIIYISDKDKEEMHLDIRDGLQEKQITYKNTIEINGDITLYPQWDKHVVIEIEVPEYFVKTMPFFDVRSGMGRGVIDVFLINNIEIKGEGFKFNYLENIFIDEPTKWLEMDMWYRTAGDNKGYFELLVPANFEFLKYRVKYDGNGGQGNLPIDDKEYSYNDHGEAASLKAPNKGDLSKVGYEFIGWTKEKDGDKVYKPLDDIEILSDTNLYAKWVKEADKKAEIIYDGNGGKFGNYETFRVMGRIGEKISSHKPDEILKRTGYSFSNWSYDREGREKLDDKVLKSGDSIRLYAQWDKDSSGGGRDKPDPKPEVKPEPELKPEPKPNIEKPKDRKGRELGKVLEEKIEYELNRQDHFAYMKGYKDDTIKPDGYITREEVVMVFYRLMESEYREEIETTNHNFNDIKADVWSTKAIASLSKGELLKGYEDGSFRPNEKMTRAEVSKVIARFTDTIVLETQMPDIIGHWAEDYINTVQNQGWIKGYEDGNFKPNEYLTRAEFVTMMNSLLDRKLNKKNLSLDIKSFKDSKDTSWYYEQIIESTNGHKYEPKRKEDGSEVWIELVDTQYPD